MVSFILLLSIFVSPGLDANEDEVLNEYLVKAAFLYNFAKFVEWPPCETDDCTNRKLVVGLYGGRAFNDAVGEAMDSIEGKTVGSRVISVRYLSNPEDIPGCQIVYVFSKAQVKTVLNATKGLPVLTISDNDDFVYSGGMIELMKVGAKLRFAINRKAAMSSSIKISSQLLKLARYVVE